MEEEEGNFVINKKKYLEIKRNRRRKLTYNTRRVLNHYMTLIYHRYEKKDLCAYIDADPLYPRNLKGLNDLLIQTNEHASKLLVGLSSYKLDIYKLSILRYLYTPFEENKPIIQIIHRLGFPSIESVKILEFLNTLKLNLKSCAKILRAYNKAIYLITTSNVVKVLESYVACLTSLCAFIYIGILGKNSLYVRRVLPKMPCNRIPYCLLCKKDKYSCICFAENESSYDLEYFKGSFEFYLEHNTGENKTRSDDQSQYNISSPRDKDHAPDYYYYSDDTRKPVKCIVNLKHVRLYLSDLMSYKATITVAKNVVKNPNFCNYH